MHGWHTIDVRWGDPVHEAQVASHSHEVGNVRFEKLNQGPTSCFRHAPLCELAGCAPSQKLSCWVGGVATTGTVIRWARVLAQVTEAHMCSETLRGS